MNIKDKVNSNLINSYDCYFFFTLSCIYNLYKKFLAGKRDSGVKRHILLGNMESDVDFCDNIDFNPPFHLSSLFFWLHNVPTLC